MEKILETTVPSSVLKKFEEEYHRQLEESNVSPKAQFEYSWCLVHSCYHGDIRKGIILLECLVENSEATDNRDYYFYLAVGHTRLKEYRKSLHCLKKVQEIEPGNHQAQEFQNLVSRNLRRERLQGALVTGGTVLAVGGLVGVIGATPIGRIALPIILSLARR